jgi:hypothetical protein
MITQAAPFAGTALLAAALAGSLYLALLRAPAAQPEVQPVAQATDASLHAATEFALPQRRSDLYYQAIDERPLFAPTRRPVAPIATAVAPETQVPQEPEPTIEPVTAAPSEPPPEFRLVGVMQTPKAGRVLIAIGGSAPAWFNEDDEIQGWRITSVKPGSATLTHDEMVIELEIYAQ